MINKIFLLITCILTMNIANNSVFADDSSTNYTVEPMIPENQQKDTQDYFDLLVSPGQKQELKIKISNKSNKVQKFNIAFNTATTNENGVIDYSNSKFTRDPSMIFDIDKYVRLKEKIIELHPHQEKYIFLEVKLPQKVFNGVMLGGINIMPIVKDKQVNGIRQIFSRTIALKVRVNNESVKEQIYDGEVKLDQINYHNVAKMLIRNISPTIIENVKATGSIRSIDGKELRIDKDFSDISLAPNSNFYLPIEFNSQLSPGKYIYEVHLVGKNNKWHFNKEFEINPEESRILNDTSVDTKKLNVNYILVVLFIFIITVIASLYLKMKKD
ncbi:DUF916 and DUF3324 domain-containing protein [Enterococcus faecium]|nr:DUF916 and DUF3324 domain-containing protein [Enterococcus faecium]MDQ8233371.1 DUF916 and DUF3324 domain-containing protein [Enterococcus faecium]MDQ8240699.1 DUF916 and DUF3324 domain-containing protein [Enterococcus faecium]